MRERLLHNLGLKLASLFLAFAFWLVVAGEQRVDHALRVPLDLTRLSEKLILVNDPGEFVTVRLRGPKSLVAGLAQEELDLNLELSRLKVGENLVVVRPEAIRVPRGVEVLQTSPTQLRLVLEPLVEREVSVATRVEGTPAAGYYVKRSFGRPDRVRVIGPRSEVSRVARVYTSAVNIDGRSRDFSAWTSLEPAGKSVKMNGTDAVEVFVEIGGTSRRRSP